MVLDFSFDEKNDGTHDTRSQTDRCLLAKVAATTDGSIKRNRARFQ
jgi:hypothetical protein